MPQLFTLPKVVPLSSAGGLLPGAKLYFYETGTTTAQAVYQDIDLTTPHANPVVADAAGVFSAIYLGQFATDYRVRLETSAGVLVYQLDNVPSGADVAILDQQNTFTGTDGNNGFQIRLSQTVPKIQWYATGGSTDNKLWSMYSSGTRLVISTDDDGESASSDVISMTRSGNNATIVDLKGDSNRSNGNEIATAVTGSFTGTLSDMASTTTGTVNYSIFAGHCTLYVDANIFGTSNATSMQLSGLPAATQPASSRTVICETTDSGGLVASKASVSSLVTFGKLSGSAYASNGFTSSGSKGLPAGWQITYKL